MGARVFERRRRAAEVGVDRRRGAAVKPGRDGGLGRAIDDEVAGADGGDVVADADVPVDETNPVRL
jgi:hypothetical protein